MLTFRKSVKEDAPLYFEWANEEGVRRQSFNSEKILFEEHTKWFENKLQEKGSIMLVFENELKKPVGQIRFQEEDENSFVVGISVDAASRGQGLATEMLKAASAYFFETYPFKKILAFIKEDNVASIHSFENAGYQNPVSVNIKGIRSLMFTKEN